MKNDAFQDHYPNELAHCYGCGRLNDHGHGLKTFWDGDETVSRFIPELYHIAIPGYVYGGLIASIIDCHCTGTAAAAAARKVGRELDDDPAFRFVTASFPLRSESSSSYAARSKRSRIARSSSSRPFRPKVKSAREGGWWRCGCRST
jgi:hypothetical protein